MTTQQVTALTRDGELRELIVRGGEMGFLGMEEVAEVIDGLGLDADAVEAIYQHLEEAGVELLEQTEAIARAATLAEENERPRRTATTTVEATTDALQLFLKDIGRVPLLTAADEVRLAKRIELGRPGRQAADGRGPTCASSSRSPRATAAAASPSWI